MYLSGVAVSFDGDGVTVPLDTAVNGEDKTREPACGRARLVAIISL